MRINGGTGQEYWEKHARTDPMWAILTCPAKAGGLWTREEFFATGLGEIAYVMTKAKRWAVPRNRGTVLDFGCGVGRLSQALADHFEHVTGVDISSTMIELARGYNRFGQRCEYVCNTKSDLCQFPDRAFDMVCCYITLQHIRPRLVRRYLNEFLRVLKPGGLLLFQLPGKRIRPWPGLLGALRFQLARLCALTADPPAMYMNGIEPSRVTALLEKNGGHVIEVSHNRAAGPGFDSYTYAVTRS
jgi:SAM-dependent methyltransferase